MLSSLIAFRRWSSCHTIGWTVALCVVVTACSSSNQLAEEQRLEAISALRELASGPGIELSDEDAACVADGLGEESAQTLIDAGGAVQDELVASVVDGIVTCIQGEELAATAMRPQAPNASEESIRCAAAELDADLFSELILNRFVPQSSIGPRLELEIGVVLATCLTPEELLGASDE